MENHLIDPYRDYKHNTAKARTCNPAREKKRIYWEPRTSRIKIFLEDRGHMFIKRDQINFYFEGLPPMNIKQLRLYYDRQVYKERKSKIENWSQFNHSES